MKSYVVTTRYGKSIVEAKNEEEAKAMFKGDAIRVDNLDDFEVFN